MTHYRRRILEDSPIKRAKIKRGLIKILRRHGFKRSFFRHPKSEVYVKGDSKAKVYSETEPDRGYGVAGVEIDGPTRDSEIEKEIYAYHKKVSEEDVKKRKQEISGIEKKFGIFAAFIIGGIALGLGSLTITGNAVSNLSQTIPGLLGVFLFIAGLAGMFFYSRKK